MATTNHERVGKALELLKDGLGPFVDREFTNKYHDDATKELASFIADDSLQAKKPVKEWDVAALLKLMWDSWNEVFRVTLGHSERTLVSELREVRNKWAHQKAFSSDDAYRALDSVERLLVAVSAPQADEIAKTKMELLRVRFDEQVRSEKRKTSSVAIEGGTSNGLKPWREIITPHRDVASGRYQQAEFAADLWQVHIGEGSPEYKDPAEFFRRTYLTEGLRRLLVSSAQRLAGKGGDPVVQLQTNFGGGKTHSMLAVYHLFSGIAPKELLGIDAVMKDADISEMPSVRRVVIVGNKISAGSPVTKKDGTIIRTLWGELAWQLGGAKAFKRLAVDDEKSTSPGDKLRVLLKEYGPCVILIDEWVAYARQLHEENDLPGGDFGTQFTFAQLLTESVKAAENCLLVVSLPASDSQVSPHTKAENVEVGGERGREALDRLNNVIGRVGSAWRPASAEEGFEIVRRRLFEPISDPESFKQRDVVARDFAKLYQTQQSEFPHECSFPEYEKRIKDAYPIHPEVFDRLYEDWSTLLKFQRTRGVLRLMAAVIHSLWEKGDKNPLIMPASIPIDDTRVQFELTRYLSDNWVPVIERDIDGPDSLPLQIDGEHPNLGKLSACRRVARAIYMGSAPVSSAAHRGIEDRQVKLGCVMPGESPSVFGDALRRLASRATFLYQDGARYWYSTQPTVTKLADDLAEQLKHEPEKSIHELDKRLRKDLAQKGLFGRIHALPSSSSDVPDDTDARLVVLNPEVAYCKEPINPAENAAKEILDSRGGTPRKYKNSLVFLAADKTRMQELDEALRKFLAWESIVVNKVDHNLTPQQVKQAETQKAAADGAVNARLPETYQWLLVPVQVTPQSGIEWQAFRLTGQDSLAVRTGKKLKNDELLILALGSTRLRMELDRIPLWRDGANVSVKQLIEDFARFPYLPRLCNSDVLLEAAKAGVAMLVGNDDTFAFAESYDDANKRYLGLSAGKPINTSLLETGLLVKANIAAKQLAHVEPPVPIVPTPPVGPGTGDGHTPPPPPPPPPAPKTKRFHGTVELDPVRWAKDASKVADEVIRHLQGVDGAKISITLEIEADLPNGIPDDAKRTVIENCNTLKFKSPEFEEG